MASARSQKVSQWIADEQTSKCAEEGHFKCHDENVDIQWIGEFLVAIEIKARFNTSIRPSLAKTDQDHLHEW